MREESLLGNVSLIMFYVPLPPPLVNTSMNIVKLYLSDKRYA